MAVKYVYLDQNQWIYLANDYWGKPRKPEHSGLASRIFAKVQAGELRLPVTLIHHIETLRATNPGRRQRLAEVIELFSDGWYLASWAAIIPFEIRATVAKAFGHSAPHGLRVFGKGFLFGLGPAARQLLSEGRTPERVALLEQIAALPGATYDLLTFPNEAGRRQQNEVISTLDKEGARAREDLRQVRASSDTSASTASSRRRSCNASESSACVLHSARCRGICSR